MGTWIALIGWGVWIGATVARLTLQEFGWLDVATLAVVAAFSALVLLRKRD